VIVHDEHAQRIGVPFLGGLEHFAQDDPSWPS
jgi:hypothetical protein